MPDYKINLTPELDKQLKEIARNNGVDINQLLVNAVSVYKDLKDNTVGENSVGILDKENKPIAKVNLP